MDINPDLSWYTEISRQRNLPSRCPFANVHRCPRNYQSLSLLGKAGGATEIEKSKDKELQEFWEKSELWPVTDEQLTSISGVDKKSFSKFCPEVLFQPFGFFAETLISLQEDIDVDSIFRAKGQQPPDWAYLWGGLKELHYSDCDMYSLLKEKSTESKNNYIKAEMVELKPSFMGISLDIKALITNMCIWWLKKYKKNT